jgi:hypothetical protein
MASQFIQKNDDLAVPLPITETAQRIAAGFAQAQSDPVKAATVRLNTLAVCVVDSYCQMMGIPTARESSDSWDPLMRTVADVADLMLPTLGQLECRPVTGNATVCPIPPEVWELRVGYVVVAIDEARQTANLLGFVPHVETEELPLAQLQPVEDLLDYLYELQQSLVPNVTKSSDLGVNNLFREAVNLSQWLNASFETGWQAVEDLLSPNTLSPAFSFRGELDNFSATTSEETASPGIKRAKLINLALQLGHQQVVLVVEMQVESPQQVNLGLQVHPTGDQPYLPAGLELAVLEPTEEVFMQARSRQADNYIQLQLSGAPGERFKVRLSLEEASYIEEFVI